MRAFMAVPLQAPSEQSAANLEMLQRLSILTAKHSNFSRRTIYRAPCPKDPKARSARRRDRNAIKVARIATGEEEEDMPNGGKDPAAKSLGSRGGKARAEALSAKRRREIASQAARKRWKS